MSQANTSIKNIVLAYSGDTSVNRPWIRERYSAEVITFMDDIQTQVTGTARLKLDKGSPTILECTLPHSLYRQDVAAFAENDVSYQAAAEGFIKLSTRQPRIAKQLSDPPKQLIET